ncbi:hypothetical protein OAI69_00050 [bacterium]|nr:hypothetical protein [bacterium]
MKISKQLSKYLLIFLLFIFSGFISLANEPVDIWNIEKVDNQEIINSESDENINKNTSQEIIQGVKIQQQNENITVNQELDTKNIKLVGLYDPEENGLNIDMWSNSDGAEIKKILEDINEKKLSDISKKILEIALLTNSYYPLNNISSEKFIDFKFQYLIQKKDFRLIKKFLIKNSEIENKDKLVRFYVDFYLVNSQIEKSCEIFDIVNLVKSDYLNNFKIYCLINQDKKEEAQLLFDLKTELGDIDEFFSNKFNILMGYKNKDENILDNNIFNLHLSHKTSESFSYEPNLETPDFIWKYLSTSNLLKKADLVDLENIDQIKVIEKGTNAEVYEEKELLDIYKKFQFDFNQLLNAKETFKLLPDYQARALLYQRLLLSADLEQKLDYSLKLKNSFNQSNLSNAFNIELSKILKLFDEEQIPSNFTSFYNNNKEPEKIKKSKIKFNNKIVHQSKLLNYFLNKTSLPQVEKETNDLLKKVKRNKKYVFSKKDIIMIESLKADGVKILKKYDKLYKYKSNLTLEINSKIVNGETGLVLLKLIEIIGEDEIEDLDIESVIFVVQIMNELNTIDLRNQILLKVLPLKV